MAKKFPYAGWILRVDQFGRPAGSYSLTEDTRHFPKERILFGPKPLDSEVEFYCRGKKPSIVCIHNMQF